MQIITLNVGQGHLSIVRNKTRAFIVDAHIPALDESYEFVKKALSKVLSSDGDKVNVEGLLLTGLDKDHAHARGVQWILNTYLPDWVVYPKYFKDTENATDTFKAIENAKSAKKIQRFPVRLDTMPSRSTSSDGFSFEFFSPHADDLTSSNNGSIVARVMSNDRSPGSLLITGDTEIGRWEQIHKRFKNKLKSDVLQAPHHGADNGAHEESIKAIAPHTVHISAGENAQYQHPHPNAVKLYRKHAKEVHCTKRGTIWTTVTTDWLGCKSVQTKIANIS